MKLNNQRKRYKTYLNVIDEFTEEQAEKPGLCYILNDCRR